MSVLITTNEPQSIKDLFVDSIEVPMNFDMKLYTESGTVGMERKKVPSDLLASVEDGRLRREIIAMKAECDHRMVILHGVMKFDKHGMLMSGKRQLRWSRTGIRNLIRTMEWMEGCFVENAVNDDDLVALVLTLQDYLDKQKHYSLKGRPGVQKSWLVPTKDEKYIHFYDGLPGIAPVRARMLLQAFPHPLDLFQANIEQISDIRGFGKPIATGIYNFLRGI